MSASDSVVELPVENLVFAVHTEHPDVIKVKVYEREDFGANPHPESNQEHVAEYPICPSHLPVALAELREMYTGWAKLDKAQPTKLIGIHNEDPFTLYIQFALGERYFVYERSQGSESVREELFGREHHLRQRYLDGEDERYLIALLRFMPKTRKAISAYTRRNTAAPA